MRAAASRLATSTSTQARCTSRNSLPDGSGQWIELKFGNNGITPGNPVYSFADARPTC